jgi:ADP-heptose:LPS heptosyltransferase
VEYRTDSIGDCMHSTPAHSRIAARRSTRARVVAAGALAVALAWLPVHASNLVPEIPSRSRFT